MTNHRHSPIELDKETFRQAGYQLIDRIADFIGTIAQKPVTTGESISQLKSLLTPDSLPETGTPAGELLANAADLLFNHSLLNGHPKFLGYITSSAAPLGALAELLAASVNPNVGAQILSPVATEIEKQTVKWLAELIGLPPGYGGLLVSGGNMANFTAFLAAITAKSPAAVREQGLAGTSSKLAVYCSTSTHTWIEKAAVLSGLGSQAIRWIPTGAANRIDPFLLKKAIQVDIEQGYTPILVVGTAGDVSTGVVDDLNALSAVCKTYDLWFHIDGAYGMPAAVLPELANVFEGITEADSLALDPHKWLYSPLEAGCTLVKNPMHLLATYSSHPDYYNFTMNGEEDVLNYYEYGLQNSRGFRALKVWLLLQQAGKSGFREMIRQDIELSRLLYKLAAAHPELEAITQNLSITTFRYVPAGISGDPQQKQTYLDELNKALLNRLQQGGEVFLSNAIVHQKYCLRACIVNFRTSVKDMEEITEIIVREGRNMHLSLQRK